jgi:hypothetical protein
MSYTMCIHGLSLEAPCARCVRIKVDPAPNYTTEYIYLRDAVIQAVNMLSLSPARSYEAVRLACSALEDAIHAKETRKGTQEGSKEEGS